MKNVWFIQEYNSMHISEVFTTKKAAFAKVKMYGAGKFHKINSRIYQYFTKDNYNEPVCYVEKVPVIHNTRSG